MRRRGRQRIHGRVDAERGDLAGQLGRGVQVGEGGERRRVGVVVGRHVHGLQRRDRAALGRGDALLQLAHLVGQGGLVAHGGGHAAEQRRHLGAGLHEAEDVVHEQQHVLVLHVTEVLGHGEGGQGHPQADARRLVHLAEDEGGLLQHAGLGHLDAEVGALPGPLADAGEHGHAAVLLGHAADHLGDEHRLAHAGAAEQADLAAGQVRREEVDDLDAGLEHPLGRLQLVEARCVPVDLPALQALGVVLVDVERCAPGVPDVPEHLLAHGHGDAPAGVADGRAPLEAVRRLEADRPHPAAAELLGHLGQHDEPLCRRRSR